MTKKLMIELDDRTFALLEVLAYGLYVEQPDLYPLATNKQKDDFSPMVNKLLTDAAKALAEGTTDHRSWQREIIDRLTGWEGTFNRGMAAECIKDEMKNW